MNKVTGIGGIFFRARDPAALALWYQRHLGIDPVPQNADEAPWMQQAGPTVFAPFPADSDYFGRAEQGFMLNLRTDDLAGLLAGLEAAGIDVSHRQNMEGVGDFARIHDPEGNPVELWQPAG